MSTEPFEIADPPEARPGESAGFAGELDLLRGLPSPAPIRHRLSILIGSLLVHLALFTAAVQVPAFTTRDVPAPVSRRVTHLYLPPDLLTQRAPNRREVTRNIDLASLLTQPQPAARAAVSRPSVRHFEAPQTAPARTPQRPSILPDVPTPDLPVAKNANPPAGITNPLSTTAPPPPKPAQLSPFQDVGSDVPANPNPTLRPPKTDYTAPIPGVARNAPGQRPLITDDSPARTLPGTLGSDGSGNGPHAAVELQSDPQGADFRAYLTQVLTIVRANWRRVIPESVKMGALRGRTTLEFAINRDGRIPKMVIASPSGSDALDRAAAAGLSMSDPLPPLPSDYRGMQVRLAFTFTYNLQSTQ